MAKRKIGPCMRKDCYQTRGRVKGENSLKRANFLNWTDDEEEIFGKIWATRIGDSLRNREVLSTSSTTSVNCQKSLYNVSQVVLKEPFFSLRGCLHPVYCPTPVYPVYSKMMEKGREKKHPTCFFPSPSFYSIHCSDAWNAFQTHKFSV